MNNSQRGFVAPLALLIIVVLLIGGGVTYVYTNKKVETAQSTGKTTHYSNQFYSFDYPEDMSIIKTVVYDTHEKTSSGHDRYGVTGLRFEGPHLSANVASLNWLNTATPPTPEQSVAEDRHVFEQLRKFPTDTFEQISVGRFRGTRTTYPYFENSQEIRPGSLDVAIYSNLYVYILHVGWEKTDLQNSATLSQKKASDFAELFINSFVERQ